jgi:hypothetical protein
MERAKGEWVVDGKMLERGKNLGLELLFSIRETVPKGFQNEALAAAIAFLLGRHYVSILELGGVEEADGWLSTTFAKAQEIATHEGAKVSFAFVRKD